MDDGKPIMGSVLDIETKPPLLPRLLDWLERAVVIAAGIGASGYMLTNTIMYFATGKGNPLLMYCISSVIAIVWILFVVAFTTYVIFIYHKPRPPTEDTEEEDTDEEDDEDTDDDQSLNPQEAPDESDESYEMFQREEAEGLK